MNKESKQKFWLGVFVISGLFFLSVILYALGDRQTFFDRTITVKTIFGDVSGLRTGNSVRMSGVNIGNVEEIQIIDDSSVLVSFIIEQSMQRYIRSNATASVETDGLMGNKLVIIHPGKRLPDQAVTQVQDGDTLAREPSIELGDMLTVLEQTNQNIASLSAELVGIIKQVSAGEGSLGKLIAEPDLVNSLEAAITSIQSFSQQGNTALGELTGTVAQINEEISEGEGMVGALLSDSSMTNNLSETMTNLQQASEEISAVGTELQTLVQEIQTGEGTASALLTDPEMAREVEATLINVRKGSDQFTEVMEALKHNILLRRYFKNQAKEADKSN